MKFKVVVLIRIWVTALILVPFVIYGQETKRTDQHDKVVLENIKKHINYFCSPLLNGRSPLTGHDALAAQYIDSVYSSFVNLGTNHEEWKTHPQNFYIFKTTPAQRSLITRGNGFIYSNDFISLRNDPPQEIPLDVVFGGLGDIEDVEELDLKGKALLVLTSNLKIAALKVQTIALTKGCSAIIVANPSKQKQYQYVSQGIMDYGEFEEYSISKTEPKPVIQFLEQSRNPIPVILINNRVAETILGVKPQFVWDSLEKGSKPLGIQSDMKVQFDFNYQVDSLPSRNIIGWISAKTNTQQSIVLCAHFDHLAPEDGKWYPGADDNASGSAVLIELARLLSEDVKKGYIPNRNIVFVSCSAEEIGLLGSHFYSLNPLFPIDSTTLLMNLDMVGRMNESGAKPGTLYIGGNNRIDDFTRVLKSVRPDTTFVIDGESQAGITVHSLSDHYHYDHRGVPSFLLTSGLHPDYHEPTDTPEKLSYQGMVDVVNLLYNAVRHFADDPNPWEKSEKK